jgi:hypothetical protein
MKKVARVVSGAAVGGAMLSLGILVSPAAASPPGGGFCDETPSYVCCCSTNSDGSIIDCSCMPRGGVQAT